MKKLVHCINIIVCLLPLLLASLMPASAAAGTIPADADTTAISALFDEAKDLQKNGDFAGAIARYQQLVAITPPAGEEEAAVEPLAESLLQLMYCYIFANRREDGAEYFTRLRRDSTCWIARRSPRDIEISTAYALYEAARPDQAAALVDTTLARPEEGRSPERLYVDYGVSSVIYNQVGQIRKAIDCNNRSLAILRTLPDKSKMAFVLGNLVYQYQQIGEFDRALAAYDSLIVSGQGEINPYGLCAAEANTVHLFDEWGIEEEVKNHLAKARQAAETCAIPDAFLRVDNLAAYYALLQKDYPTAASLIDSLETRLPDRSQHSFYHRFYDNYRCVLAIGTAPKGDHSYLAAARKMTGELAGQPLDDLAVLSCRLLGDALADKGDDALAIETYSICCDYIGRNNLLNQQRHIYYALAELYSRTGRTAEACRYYPLASRANSRFTERRNAGLISQFRVKYETRKKEQQNKLLRSEVMLKQRTIENNLILIVALLLLSGAAIGWFILCQRALKLQHIADSRQHELDLAHQREARLLLEEKEQQLRQMLSDRRELNRKNEELRNELERSDARTSLEGLISSLSPRLLTSEEEQDFRREFCLIHPSFLPRLREICPDITRSEELLAMLIRLQLTPEEIALALGNNRASVHTSHSRLRKKMQIPKETPLDEFFRNL